MLKISQKSEIYMNIKEILAKTILRKRNHIDSWFVTHYGMNLYRGCPHDCIYCDGRAEKYQVEGEFEKDIGVKTNAISILQRELSPRRKRKPFKRSFILLGGGVGDSYQPVEKDYLITRKALQLIHDYNFPVHILTKSTLVMRDLDIITKINDKYKAMVNFSFSSSDDKTSSIFEPSVPSPSERLNAITRLRSEGIHSGVFLMPVIPFITDRIKIMEKTMKDIKDAGAEYVIFGGMTLKPGRQWDYFMKVLEKHNPNLIEKYNSIYIGDKWGNAIPEYYQWLNKRFAMLAHKYKIPTRIPIYIYNDILAENDLVVVILQHLHYTLRQRGGESPYGYASHSISRLEVPLSSMKDRLTSIKGVGKVTGRLINEILESRDCQYLENLQNYRIV